jgi:nicotinamidase-related amidase
MTLFRTFKEIVDPAHTCLVVWDVQNRLVDSIFNKEDFLRSLKAFLEEARKREVPIIYTKIDSLPMAYESGWRTYVLLKRYKIDDPAKISQFARTGTHEDEISSEVAPSREDVVLNDKYTADIFIGTSFENMMRNRGVETILFTGISTEYGVESSARDASNRGFYTVVVSDCVSSPNREMHDASLRVLDRLCIVASSSDIMVQWRG